MAAHSLDYIPTALMGAIAESELLAVKGRDGSATSSARSSAPSSRR
jgi:hypothetical protein